jgi:4-hydroxy-tetrahydrodipicolinate reductase
MMEVARAVVPASARSPRVILYGVGRYGQEFVRLAAGRGVQVVAAVNRAGAKVGRELGDVCGLAESLGVTISDCDTFDYRSVEADIGVVFVADRLVDNQLAHERLLGAGLNVICHGTESYYPWGSDPECAWKIDALAKAHDVTFTGTGIWDMSRIWSGILLAGQSVSIESLQHQTVTQINYPSPRIAEYAGLDLTPAQFDEKFRTQRHSLAGMYKTIPEHVLTALGYTVTGVDEVLEPVVFDAPIYSQVLQRNTEVGRTVGLRFRITVDTTEGVSATADIELRYLRPGETERMVWDVTGTPGSRMVIERRDSVAASAAAVVNRIPDVINAPSGIQLVSQLGPMKPGKN